MSLRKKLDIADRRELFLAVGAWMLIVWMWDAGASAQADERLKGIACRSVHLGFPAPKGAAFYNEVTVDKSAPGSYFMVCGFRHGYFGIQELTNGKNVVLFSVWDAANANDPNVVPEERRVRVLYHDEAVRIGRFGNEGTGGQSFFDLDWRLGETYRFLTTAKPNGDRTEYSAFLFDSAAESWRRLVTFSTITGGDWMSGYYSFVEDFRRNRVSATQVRRAQFGPVAVRTPDGEWQVIDKARFTADSNPVTNIDAGSTDAGRFFLATGGETSNDGARLGGQVELDSPPSVKLDDLPSAP